MRVEGVGRGVGFVGRSRPGHGHGQAFRKRKKWNNAGFSLNQLAGSVKFTVDALRRVVILNPAVFRCPTETVTSGFNFRVLHP